ncbi:hypothetical protein [Paraburkholderia lycopersici]|uniref:hypothetical protein n=1 Tax=Paraburkholderia lycopersici TaxID=416944 RepID=UPI0015A36453
MAETQLAQAQSESPTHAWRSARRRLTVHASNGTGTSCRWPDCFRVHHAELHALGVSLFLIGFGQGVALPALLRRNVERIDRCWSGLAAEFVRSVLQVSAALVVAVPDGLFFALAGPDASGEHVTRISRYSI